MNIKCKVFLNAKDLFRTLPTCRNSIDRLIRAEGIFIFNRYYFVTKNVNSMICVPVKVNLSDVLTKTSSPFSQTPQLTMFFNELSIDVSDALTRSSNQFTG